MACRMVLSCLLLAVQLALVFTSDVRQPFRVEWNYPDGPCKALHINFELDKFHIEHNKHSFVENAVAIFYSDHSGKWPYIDFKNGGKYVNGGLPKDIDMAGHLEALKKDVEAAIKPDANGFGVIDMENWRPVYHTNYGRYTPYKTIFWDLMAKENPGLERQKLRRLVNEEWKKDALDVMVQSLKALKEVRPNEHWGYYGYPQYVTKNQNGQLGDLWEHIDAYYPSIYVKKHDESVAESRHDIMEVLAEAFRIRAEYGHPSNPIMPYTMAQYRGLGLLHGDWLTMEIRLPLEMGVDGLILWASSDDFMPPKEKCAEENKFIHETLGPLIEDELERMTKCSEQLCSAKGRCVKKEYADSYPYLQSRGVPEEVLATASPSGVEAIAMDKVDEEFQTDFVCQCYDGSTGDRCTDAYED